MTHTPGPWIKESDHSNRLRSVNKYGTVVCSVYGDGQQEANTSLIAAAPELLAALQSLVGEADLGEIDHDNETRAMLAAARAAIAKATGE